jgi:hypothetical protein
MGTDREKQREYYARWMAKYPGRRKAQAAKRRARDREALRLYDASYRAAHRARIAENYAKFKSTHPESLRAHRARWAAAHPEQKAALSRAWSAAHPEKHREYRARYARANPELIKARDAAWKAAHADRIAPAARLRTRAWAQANPDRVRARLQFRRAQKQNASAEPISVIAWAALIAQCDHRCVYCLRRAPLTQDHVEPLARGGAHAIDNVVPACLTCNTSKNDTTLLQFLLRRRT